ncbi:MAG TPA: hypothetical protein VKD22_15665 [Ramlibacter sp.]|nr:hypothetical protein [Ramlibacter sp.]
MLDVALFAEQDSTAVGLDAVAARLLARQLHNMLVSLSARHARGPSMPRAEAVGTVLAAEDAHGIATRVIAAGQRCGLPATVRVRVVDEETVGSIVFLEWPSSTKQ